MWKYNRSRFNLGFSGIGYSMKEMCLKGRDFEVPMAGALYLTSEQHDLHRVSKVGEEVVTYRGKSDCLAKIRYLLDHEDESASSREAALVLMDELVGVNRNIARCSQVSPWLYASCGENTWLMTISGVEQLLFLQAGI